jgi:ABC-type phosphate transport system substrate-binding protein
LLADVLVVTGAKSQTITLRKNQVSDIFIGNVVSLPDGSSVTPVDQPESNPLRDEFYLKVSNKSAAQAKARWAKLYFTGRGVPPREGIDSVDVKRILNSTPGAIGYIEKSSLDSSVKVVFIVQ